MKKQKSLRQQARELQVSPSYLSMILSGQRQPNPGLRAKLCSLGMFTDKAEFFLEGRNSTTELLPQNQIYFTSNIMRGKQKEGSAGSGQPQQQWQTLSKTGANAES